MNHYILIGFLIVICILMAVFIYKIDTADLNNKNEMKISDNIKLEENLVEVQSNIDSVTNDNKGNIYIFKNDKYWKLVDGSLDPQNSGENIHEKLNVPKSWNSVTLPSFDVRNNRLVFVKENKVYQNNQTPFPLNKYWTGLSNEDINFNHILPDGNNLIFIKGDNFFVYDTETNKKTKKQNLNTKLNGVKLNEYDGIFFNKNDHNLGEPSGSLNVVKGDKYYKYDSVEKKLINPGHYFNSGLINTKYIQYRFDTLGKTGIHHPRNIDNTKYRDKVVSIQDGVQSWIVPRDSNYRIICVGAGKPNGGFGGKVFNDLKLKKGDKVDVLVGQSGANLPLANNSNDKKLNKMGSSSGSGATYVWVNKKLVSVAGGGGGWSSEIHQAPDTCNSQKYNENTTPSNAKIHIPIKSICITCENSKNTSKIVLNNLNTNTSHSNINITETPSLNQNKKFLAETDYSTTPPMIKIDFDQYLLDYSIELEYDVLTSDSTNALDLVKVYGTDGDVYNIYNFNKKYNNQPITAELILTEKLGYIPKCIERNNQLVDDALAKSGGNISDAKNTNTLKNKSTMDKKENSIIINGGFGGGGAASCDKDNLNICNCGGGGGFMGGNSGVSNITEDINGNKYSYKTINENEIEVNNGENKVRVKIPFVSASGGSSFVTPSNIDKTLVKENDYKNNWVNDYNNGNGYVVIVLLKDLHKKVDKSNTEEYISKTLEVIKNMALEKPIDGDLKLNLEDSIISSNKKGTIDGVSSISDIDNSYNIQSFGLKVKAKDIDTSSCSTMANVVIGSDLYNKKMINKNTNPIVDKSFYKSSSLRGLCDKSITLVKFPISNRANLRNVKINIKLDSEEEVNFSGMFSYIHVKENSILRYLSYVNRPEEDIIPDDLLSFNISRERCEIMKEHIFEELSELNISGFSNNFNWEEIKNSVARNMEKYPKYLENDNNFNLLFDKTKQEGKIFSTQGNYKANIKTKWNGVEPDYLYILLKNNNSNPNVFYNVSFIEYDMNGISTFDYLKIIEIANLEEGEKAISSLRKKREYMSYEINKQIEDIMCE